MLKSISRPEFLRPGTAADVAEVDPSVPCPSARLWAAELDGEVLGVMGYTAHQNAHYAWSMMKPEAGRHKKKILQAGRWFCAQLPPGTQALCRTDSARRFLISLGWRRIMRAGQGELMIWQTR